MCVCVCVCVCVLSRCNIRVSIAHQVLQMMSTVNWVIKDIKSQHSSYVDTMLQVWSALFTDMKLYVSYVLYLMQEVKKYKEQIHAIEK